MLQDWISAIEGWIPALADSLWVYPALTLFALVDGFFPPIPSESVVIGLASLSVSHGAPNLALIALAGALGAFAGDQIAYTIGSQVDVHRLRIFRSERGRRTLAWAEHALEHRGSSFILAARYIPVGRVAVNMTAGALRYPRRRFVGLTALAAVTWAGYGTAVGVGAGVWLESHPLVAVVAGVVVGTLVGVAIDWVLRRWTGLGRAVTVGAPTQGGPEAEADGTDASRPDGRGAGTPGPGAAGPGVQAPGTSASGAGAADAGPGGGTAGSGAGAGPAASGPGAPGGPGAQGAPGAPGAPGGGPPGPGTPDGRRPGADPRRPPGSSRVPVAPLPDADAPVRPAALAVAPAEAGARVTSRQRSGPAR
ncbi:DedA family protein [Cellulomonas sp. ES6]|uniref:DedA family protein n=1 Tax=Cellulomonas sp. ES6 TaxID=3039384 RepID=UPI0024B7A287|nr:DedA family protein [Cellulomonas sp. ES6]WHP17003.1 DedA family protein [Cellulomonas sp. ES6]